MLNRNACSPTTCLLLILGPVATKVFTVVWSVFVAFAVEGPRFAVGRIKWSRHLASLPLGGVTGLLIGGVIIGSCRPSSIEPEPVPIYIGNCPPLMND